MAGSDLCFKKMIDCCVENTSQPWGQEWKPGASEEAAAIVLRETAEAGPGGGSGGSEKWSASQYVFKLEPTGLFKDWMWTVKKRSQG